MSGLASQDGRCVGRNANIFNG